MSTGVVATAGQRLELLTVAGRGTPATALLAKQHIPHTVHAYEHDPRRAGYGQEASDVLGVAPERVFKTLVAQVDGALTVGVVPVGSRLTSRRWPRQRAAAGRPWPTRRTRAANGYVVGGMSRSGSASGCPW